MRIKLFGHIIDVQFNNTLEKETGSYGIIDLNNLICKVDNNIAESMKFATVIHEVIEATNFLVELNLNHNQISALGSSIVAALLDNRSITDMIDSARGSFNGVPKEETKTIPAKVNNIYDSLDKEINGIMKSIKGAN